MKKLTILLPTLNEEKAIKKVIQKTPVQAIKKLGYNIKTLVVDGGSKDNTVKIAREQGAHVIQQKGKGKGNAIKTALKILKKDNPDITVMLDADNSYNPQDIPQLILPLITEEADITIGSRDNKSHNIGNKLLTMIANNAYKTKTTDLCTGYWAFNNKAIRQIDIKAKGFDLETDLFNEVNKKKLKMKSIPIHYRERIGNSKLKHKDSIIIISRMIRNIRDWNPLILFSLSGIISLLIGGMYGYRVILDYQQYGYVNALGTFMLTILLSITGVFLIGIGLIVDLLEQKTN